MAYEKTNWVDGVTPLDAAHMNKIEEGIANASQEASQSSTDISQLQTQVEGLVNDTTEIKADIAELTTSDESKLPKQDVDVLQDISINVQGDQAFLTKTTINLDNDTLTPTQGSSTQIIPDATSTQSGLMTASDVIAIQNMQEQIQQLQTKATRLLYTEKTDPTADDINTFVVSQGYTNPFVGIAVVVSGTNHIWYYYEGDIGWRDDGVDVVSNFTNTVAGIIKGSTSDGQVYANSDGTGSVNGWDTVKQNITDIQEQLTGFDTSNLVDLTSDQIITGEKIFQNTNAVLKIGNNYLVNNNPTFVPGIAFTSSNNTSQTHLILGWLGNLTSAGNRSIRIAPWYGSATGESAIAIGNNVFASGIDSIAIGSKSNSSGQLIQATAEGSIQLGKSYLTNQVANDTPFMLQVYDYPLLDGTTGKIPTERLDLSSITPTMQSLTISNTVVDDTIDDIVYDGSTSQTVVMPETNQTTLYLNKNYNGIHFKNILSNGIQSNSDNIFLGFDQTDFKSVKGVSGANIIFAIELAKDFVETSTTVAGKPLSSNVTLGQLTLTQAGETLGTYRGEQDVTIDIPAGSGSATLYRHNIVGISSQLIFNLLIINHSQTAYTAATLYDHLMIMGQGMNCGGSFNDNRALISILAGSSANTFMFETNNGGSITTSDDQTLTTFYDNVQTIT